MEKPVFLLMEEGKGKWMGVASLGLWAYKVATYVLAVFMPFYLERRVQRGKEIRSRLQERYGVSDHQRPEGPLIWCHGASVGEALSLLPIIERLCRERPDITLLMTTGTVTSAKLMQERLPDGAMHQFIPLDHPTWGKRFLDHWRPNCILWLESEFWPNLLRQIQQKDIPLVLVNGRMSQKTFEKWCLIPSAAQMILQGFDLCLGQESSHRDRFLALGVRAADYVGNLKFASSPLPVKESDLKEMQQQLQHRPCWVAASTHPGEEVKIAAAHHLIKAQCSGILTIIVPRHPQRGTEIAQYMETAGLQVAQRSLGQQIETETDIYLADTLGELGLFYRLVNIAFIGGSLVPHGGHNPIEPALLHTALICGPYMDNFREIEQLLQNATGYIAIQDVQSLAQTVCHLVYYQEERERLQSRGYKAVQQTQGDICDAVWQKIVPFFPPV